MDRVSLSKISQIIQGNPGDSELIMPEISGISINSRSTKQGDLFFAIQGKRQNGHKFVPEAIKQGAQACVVKRGMEVSTKTKSLIYVDDVNHALQQFASWYRRQHSLTVIGVTGSVGKTTTRTMIHQVLSSVLQGIQSPANYNNEFGVPLSIAQIENRHQFAVLELGASRSGEIRELAQISQPNIGVITGIGPSHLEHFGTLDQTANAKGELFEQLSTDGVAIVNGDDPFASQLASKSVTRTLKVGFGKQNDVQAESVRQTPNGILFRTDGTEFLIPVLGKHFVYAALFAIAIGKEFGISNHDLVAGVGQFSTVTGRCHAEQIGPWTIIDDSYNSSPVSMAAACQVVQNWPCSGKKVVVMGDMLELGSESKRYHQEIGELIASSGVDLLFACGKQSGAVVEGALWGNLSRNKIVQAADVEEVQDQVYSWLEPGDIVLVKGSRSLRMERLITNLKQRVGIQGAMKVDSEEKKHHVSKMVISSCALGLRES